MRLRRIHLASGSGQPLGHLSVQDANCTVNLSLGEGVFKTGGKLTAFGASGKGSGLVLLRAMGADGCLFPLRGNAK